VCPREAISLSDAVLDEGRLAAMPQVDIDAARCNFCGECVALCPTHALRMTVNGEPEVPVVKAEAFPLLVRTMVVDEDVCRASTDVSYVDNCPVGAIHAEIERDAQGAVTAVDDVTVDKATCINCTRCMEEGPSGAFTVTKPYKGRAYLDVTLCPAGCQACADVCPTDAITYDGARVHLDDRFCLYCGACEKVCPAPGAVRITRSGFVHTPIESGAWALALEKLVSFREVAREFDVKGQQRRRRLVLHRLLEEMKEEA
jgi:4Fe-4S ferredoxin